MNQNYDWTKVPNIHSVDLLSLSIDCRNSLVVFSTYPTFVNKHVNAHSQNLSSSTSTSPTKHLNLATSTPATLVQSLKHPKDPAKTSSD